MTFEWFQRFFLFAFIKSRYHQQPFEVANAERLLFPGLTSEYLKNSFFTDPFAHIFSFFNISTSTSNYIVSGVSNSFFFSLPFSLPHLISIKRLFSQGIKAAAASLIGIIAAHSLFLISVFYGLRFLIIPWFSLEPVTYIFGFTANILIIKELIQTSNKSNAFVTQQFQKGAYLAGSQTFSLTNFFDNAERTQPLSQKRGDQIFTFSPLLLRIGFLSFLLTWCEEINVFSCITNLTFNAQNTYLDLYPSSNASQFLGIHTIYILSFIVGNCVFSLFFYYLFLKSTPLLASWTNLSNAKVNDAINKLVMLLIITFTFASFPYYGLDYLFGKVGGFLPEDPVYKESVLSPSKITLNKKNTIFIKDSTEKKKRSLLLDVNNFDNGIYLKNIDFYKRDNIRSKVKGSIVRNPSFEKTNYRQENAWIRRNYLAKYRARPKKRGDPNTGISAPFYKAFQDPKAYYKKMRLESERKQLEKIRENKVKDSSGYFVNKQEGILAKEPVSKIQDFWDQVFGFPRQSEAFTHQTLLQSNRNEIEPYENQVVPKQNFHLDGVKNANLFTGNDQAGKDQQTNLLLTKPKKESYRDFLETLQQNNNSSQTDKELDFETNISVARYTKGVEKKKQYSIQKKQPKSLTTKKGIKRKYFLNPIYRALLQTDIDTFMARQPSKHNIAENQDHDLYKKRMLLEKYYNWLRYYSPLQKDLQNVYHISSSKSFVDSAFHHQFKGSLKIAKRLFPVTFDAQQNRKQNRVLSYDQTLYKDLPNSENPLLHEELLPYQNKIDVPNNSGSTKNKVLDATVPPFSQPNFSELDSKLQLNESQIGGVLPNDKATLLQKNSKNITSKEKLQESTSGVNFLNSLTHTFNTFPFIEESDSAPFYAGWDETLRRFVITNQFFIET